ncbi:MAG: DUF1542 domain-containing protein [Corynebacterium sp.]|nr:DUF1542 domain-containing protein [Corynebacterium sp.]
MGLILFIGSIVIILLVVNSLAKKKKANARLASLDDAVAEARRWIERLGSQVLSLSGTDTASTQALADASERYNAASSQISTTTTVKQAELARESALEGLYYVNVAREIIGLPAGPELPPLEGQRQAGKVTETRTIEYDGQNITASPVATNETPNYYPGGTVAGRPVPAGWYSQAWWAPALATGMWAVGSMMLFSSLFTGMAGINQDFSSIPDTGDLGDDAAADVGGDDGGGFFDGLFGDGGFFDFGGDGGDFSFDF